MGTLVRTWSQTDRWISKFIQKTARHCHVSSGYHRHCRFFTHERYRARAKTMAADRVRPPPRRFHRSLSTNTSMHLVTRQFVKDTGSETIRIGDPRWTFDDKTAAIHGPLVFGIGSEVRPFLSTFSHAWLLLIVIKRAKVPTPDFYLLFSSFFPWPFYTIRRFYDRHYRSEIT